MSLINYKIKNITLPVTDKSPFNQTGVQFVWLGQSGFLFVVDGYFILVDPYLSNFLEENEEGLPYSHKRLMENLLDESLYKKIDLFIASHDHPDHIDPQLVKDLVKINEKVIFAAPAGCFALLKELGVKEEKIVKLSPKERFTFKNCLTIESFPAAHPVADFDSESVKALSYKFAFGSKSILFAGDTTVYPMWSEWVANSKWDLMLLPVNGRDPIKEANGIVGNMNLMEAIAVALKNRATLLGTHYDMFAFNTIEYAEAKAVFKNFNLEDEFDLTKSGLLYSL